jgi:hypothetical protein
VSQSVSHRANIDRGFSNPQDNAPSMGLSGLDKRVWTLRLAPLPTKTAAPEISRVGCMYVCMYVHLKTCLPRTVQVGRFFLKVHVGIRRLHLISSQLLCRFAPQRCACETVDKVIVAASARIEWMWEFLAPTSDDLFFFFFSFFFFDIGMNLEPQAGRRT